jgi:hypothetical protein
MSQLQYVTARALKQDRNGHLRNCISHITFHSLFLPSSSSSFTDDATRVWQLPSGQNVVRRERKLRRKKILFL